MNIYQRNKDQSWIKYQNPNKPAMNWRPCYICPRFSLLVNFLFQKLFHTLTYSHVMHISPNQSFVQSFNQSNQQATFHNHRLFNFLDPYSFQWAPLTVIRSRYSIDILFTFWLVYHWWHDQMTTLHWSWLVKYDLIMNASLCLLN